MLVIALWGVGASIVAMIGMLIVVSIARNLDGTTKARRAARAKVRVSDVASRASTTMKSHHTSGPASLVTEQVAKAFTALRAEAPGMTDEATEKKRSRKALTMVALIFGVLMAIIGALTDN